MHEWCHEDNSSGFWSTIWFRVTDARFFGSFFLMDVNRICHYCVVIMDWISSSKCIVLNLKWKSVRIRHFDMSGKIYSPLELAEMQCGTFDIVLVTQQKKELDWVHLLSYEPNQPLLEVKYSYANRLKYLLSHCARGVVFK